MGITPSSPTVPVASAASPGILGTFGNSAVFALRPKAEGLNDRSEKAVYSPSPDVGYWSKRSHKAGMVQGIQVAGRADADTMATSKKPSVDWSGMHVQNAQRPKVRSNTTTGVTIDDNFAQWIMTASDEGIADLAKSFSDPKHFPEWYMKLPEYQRNMFDKKTDEKADKKADIKEAKKPDVKEDKKVDRKEQKGKVNKTTNNASSTLGINTVLKLGTVAMLCMAMM
ncbi:hypothetical protein DV735_g4264, partial [Chaetothyriales sp. CBS 134920]